jgi:glutamine cyclotransferase
MYESTGNEGKSRLMKVDLKTGKNLQSIDIDKKYFGEGIVIINDTVYQLTYKSKVGFMYALKGFTKLGEFNFNTKTGEGWGMTTDGKQIIATDGSSQLYYFEPGSFKLIKTQDVTDAGSLTFNLNELEYINGYIYANQWQAPYILKIDPGNGQIVGKIDLSSICNRIKNSAAHADILNGIAYDSGTKKIYITGKWWPELYEIQLGE